MNKRIFLVIGVIILFIMIAIGVSTYTIIHSLIQKEKEAFKPQVENILKEAVISNITQKTKDLALNGLSNSPNKIGTYETRTFCSKDTLFTYQHQVQDIDTEIFFARQLGLLMMDSLQSTDIQNLIINSLSKNKIKGYIIMLALLLPNTYKEKYGVSLKVAFLVMQKKLSITWKMKLLV